MPPPSSSRTVTLLTKPKPKAEASVSVSVMRPDSVASPVVKTPTIVHTPARNLTSAPSSRPSNSVCALRPTIASRSPGLEQPPLDEHDLRANGEILDADAAHAERTQLPLLAPRPIHGRDDVGRNGAASFGRARDPWCARDGGGGIEGQHARAFADVRAGAQDDGAIGTPAGEKRARQATGHREYGDQHANDGGNRRRRRRSRRRAVPECS